MSNVLKDGNFDWLTNKLMENNPSMDKTVAEKYAKAIIVRQVDKTLKPNLNTLFEKFPKLKDIVDEKGNYRNTGHTLVMPFEVEERKIPDKDGEFIVETIIKGTAIYPTLSKNFNRYTKKEISKAEKTFDGIPIQEDHSRSARNTIGTIDSHQFNERSGRLTYEGRLKANHPVSENVRLGYVKNSSIGISPKKNECSICHESVTFWHEHMPGMEYEINGKKVVAENIPLDYDFTHLGITPFPGITGATAKPESLESDDLRNEPNLPALFEMDGMIEVISEAYSPYYDQIIESLNNQKSRGLNNMDEAELKELNKTIAKKDALLEEYKSEMTVLKSSNVELSAFVSEQKKKERKATVEEIVNLEVQMKRIKEEEKQARMLELTELDDNKLEARHEAILYIADQFPIKKEKKAKSRSYSDVKDENLEPELDEVAELTGRELAEAKIEYVGNTFYGPAYRPTFKTVRILDEWNFKLGRWKNPLQELV